MRDHDQCETDIAEALAHRRDGFAYYLAERCDRAHGDMTTVDYAEHPVDSTEPTGKDAA